MLGLATGRGAARTFLTQRWLVTRNTLASVAATPATATTLHQPGIQTAIRGPLALAGRALEVFLALALATGAGAPLWKTIEVTGTHCPPCK